MTTIAEVKELLWNTEGRQLCSQCGENDGTVANCDWCRTPVCLEHDDVLENRDIDSGLMLCQPCGDKFDLQNGIKFDDDGRPLIYGPPHSRDAEIVRPKPARQLHTAVGSSPV